MNEYALELGVPARGGYAEVSATNRLVNQCRQRICTLIGGVRPEGVIFTLNTTDAMNLAIYGTVRHALQTRPRGQKIHLITTDLDHNSALRPFNALVAEHDGRITQTRLRIDPATGMVNPSDLAQAIVPETLLFATVHASNVTGVIASVAELGGICRQRGVLFLLDAAQSLGHIPLNVESAQVDLLAMAGHKGLLGPTGTGALYIAPGIEQLMSTVREGGTGMRSELEAMPSDLPDRFEPGSHNTIGIAGLNAALGWLLAKGAGVLRAHELALTERMLAGLAATPQVTVHGPQEPSRRVGVFTLTSPHIAPQEFGRRLEAEFGILSRSGLHCAPALHAMLGTAGTSGGTRLSIGPFTTAAHIDAAVAAVHAIAATPGREFVELSQPQPALVRNG